MLEEVVAGALTSCEWTKMEYIFDTRLYGMVARNSILFDNKIKNDFVFKKC